MEVEMSTVTAPAVATWKVDSAHTSVEFAVRHLMITTVKGRFAEVSGVVKSHDGDPAKGEVDITINAASIDTREAQRDAHLRSADFFEVETYPTITFRSKRVDDVAGDRFTLVGDLTMHGVTKEVALDVTSEGRAKDPWGGERSGFTATAKVKRSEFGLTWNQLLETGGLAVSDDIKISIDVELVKA
jgi:polyisoprenoid-binding protein YceI